MESALSHVSWALGIDAEELTTWQMGLRAMVVYIIGVVLIRLGEKRFIGKFSAFDVIMAIMIGSVLSRAITTPGGFIPKLAAALVLIGMHHAFATLAYHTTWFGKLIKGSPRILVQNGEIQWEAMRASHISEKDLMSALRENAGVNSLEKVETARIERSGNINAILKKD